MAEGDDFERRLLLSVDAKEYSRGTGRRHGVVQQNLLAVLDDAAERTGLARARWEQQPGGDGELAVLPPGEREPRVVDDFVHNLAAALRRNNRDEAPERHLRLRLAVHFGPTMPAANGYKGHGPIVVSRLCGCGALREALNVSGADLAVVLSRQVFEDTVAQEHTSLRAADFRRVCVREKEYRDDAWILVPGHDVHSLNLPDGRPAAPTVPDERVPPVDAGPSTERPSGKSVQNTFERDVDARGAVFGFNER